MTVPAFITKLWTLVEDFSTDELIAWDSTGLSFHVLDQGRFAKDVLPLYFKHNNIASFIRQLNMYGFRKILNIEQGSLKSERDDMEFAHQFFQRDREDLLEFIKRKVSHGKAGEVDVKVRPDTFHTVLNEVHDVQDKQDQLTTSLSSLKCENEALWREVASLRQKHHKQQQIVNKLIQFLVSLVGSKHAMAGMKRKRPLMLNDASQLATSQAKIPKTSEFTFDQTSPAATAAATSAGEGGSYEGIPGQVTIQDITDESSPQAVATVEDDVLHPVGDLPPAVLLAPDLSLDIDDPTDLSKNTFNDPIINIKMEATSPDDSVTTVMVDPNCVAMPTEDVNAVATTTADPNAVATTTVDLPFVASKPKRLRQDSNREDVSDTVDTVQSDIDGLKELLSSYSIDTNTLTGLFTPDAPLPVTPDSLLKMMNEDPMTDSPLFNSSQSNANNIMGHELIQYNPAELDIGSLLDLDILPQDSTAAAPIDKPSTPSLDVSSKLAKRRLSKPKTTSVSSEDID